MSIAGGAGGGGSSLRGLAGDLTSPTALLIHPNNFTWTPVGMSGSSAHYRSPITVWAADRHKRQLPESCGDRRRGARSAPSDSRNPQCHCKAAAALRAVGRIAAVAARDLAHQGEAEAGVARAAASGNAIERGEQAFARVRRDHGP